MLQWVKSMIFYVPRTIEPSEINSCADAETPKVTFYSRAHQSYKPQCSTKYTTVAVSAPEAESKKLAPAGPVTEEHIMCVAVPSNSSAQGQAGFCMGSTHLELSRQARPKQTWLHRSHSVNISSICRFLEIIFMMQWRAAQMDALAETKILDSCLICRRQHWISSCSAMVAKLWTCWL